MLTLAGSPFLLYMLPVRREDPDHSRPQLLTATHDLSAIPATHMTPYFMPDLVYLASWKDFDFVLQAQLNRNCDFKRKLFFYCHN